MVGVDLGTRIVKVNISKIRKDHNPIEDIDIPLEPIALASADFSAKAGRRCRIFGQGRLYSSEVHLPLR